MLYGATKTTIVLDDNGSTETTAENIIDSRIVRPIRKYYEIKVRVHSKEEEQAAYLKFSDDLFKDKTMLDPAWRIEHTKVGKDNGYYYIVKCFTQLSY